jgi:hypothetical protein
MALKANTTAETTTQVLAAQGLKVIASVRESPDATDLAVTNGNAQVVVRCVELPSEPDQNALRTMVAEGDFTRAFIVHSDEHLPPAGDIPTYPLSRIDELAALLAKESAP